MNKKIAFLFLTLDNVNFPTIWEKYFSGNEDKYTVYCHPKYPDKVTVNWLKSNIISNLVETGWGYIVGAYHQLLLEAYSDTNNYKFVTISESCLPLKTFDQFYGELFDDDIKTSYIKFMEIKQYDISERIRVNAGYQNYNFHKHYARFCLSRYHVEKLLKKVNDFKFFEHMHIGDEFFLTMLEPYDSYVKDFAITYDNWEYVIEKRKNVNKKIKKLYTEMENIDKKRNKCNKCVKCSDCIKYNKLKEEIHDLQVMRDDFSKNPKSYSEVTLEDINDVKKINSFFWRKFPKNSNVEKFYLDNQCCLK